MQKHVAPTEAAGVSVLVARTKAGVLAFGTDDDVHAAFDSYNVTSFDFAHDRDKAATV